MKNSFNISNLELNVLYSDNSFHALSFHGSYKRLNQLTKKHEKVYTGILYDRTCPANSRTMITWTTKEVKHWFNSNKH